MKKIPYLLLILIIACNPKAGNEDQKINTIVGNWSFLDSRGNYCESSFNDSTFISFNLAYGATPYFNYVVKNDSMYSTIDKQKSGISKIAAFTWLSPDKVVISTQFSKDTLERLKEANITLGNTDPVEDSAIFYSAIKTRYEEFLVSKGIMTLEEIEQFKKDSIIPEDVKKMMEE